jgi:hypothetical protein
MFLLDFPVDVDAVHLKSALVEILRINTAEVKLRPAVQISPWECQSQYTRHVTEVALQEFIQQAQHQFSWLNSVKFCVESDQTHDDEGGYFTSYFIRVKLPKQINPQKYVNKNKVIEALELLLEEVAGGEDDVLKGIYEENNGQDWILDFAISRTPVPWGGLFLTSR